MPGWHGRLIAGLIILLEVFSHGQAVAAEEAGNALPSSLECVSRALDVVARRSDAEFRARVGARLPRDMDLWQLQFEWAVRRARLVSPREFAAENLAATIDEALLALSERPCCANRAKRELNRLLDESENLRIVAHLPIVRLILDGAVALEDGVRSSGVATAPIDPLRDARRLVNRIDWESALRTMPDTPWLVYGEQTWSDWAETAAWIAADADGRQIGPELLREIHRRALAHHYFRGYEVRRIEAAAARGDVSQREVQELLSRIASGARIVFSGVDQSTLPGRYRIDPLDDFPHDGERVLPDGRRVLTAWECRMLGKLRWWSVAIPPREIVRGMFVGRFLYPRGPVIEREVGAVFRRVNRELTVACTAKDVVKVVAEMTKELLAIHPFIDGNGRCVRLLGDLILRRRGLPPPVFLPENELLIPLDRLTDMYVSGMREW
ncbi:Fic family protein [Candidatus Ozemobacteraceae bacterium]|nr:Fic family protein [Candidatus Ozemobacteraceae bacterium]